MPFTMPSQFTVNPDLHCLYQADMASPNSIMSHPSPMSPSLEAPLEQSNNSSSLKRRSMHLDLADEAEQEADFNSPSPSPAPESSQEASTAEAEGESGTQPGNRKLRKRAKTKDEKEQRRVERIMRNRQAAHASREKKRRHMEELERSCEALTTKNRDLEYKLYAAQRATAQSEKLQEDLRRKLEAMEAAVQLAKASGNLSHLGSSSFQEIEASSDLTISPHSTLSQMSPSEPVSQGTSESNSLADFSSVPLSDGVADLGAMPIRLDHSFDIVPQLFDSEQDSPSSIEGSDLEDSFDFKFQSLTAGLFYEEPSMKSTYGVDEQSSIFPMY